MPELDHGFGTRLWNPDPLTMATLRQVHSNSVLAVDRPGPAGEGDALITSMRGLILSIKTADCYPILIADPRTRSIAAIHAGWRGTAGRIVAETVARMHADFGASPGDLHAAIGPGIGVCCYEVGEEVARQIGLEGRQNIDLAAINRRQLLESGVPAGQIHLAGRCTFCEPDLFHSYRRDGDQAGRMISFISIKT
jgi:YfiH family protein